MDREKVIKGLRHCTSHDDGRDKFGGVGKCGGCPYYGHDCTDRMKKDALSLLEEQEERINKMLHQPRSIICCYRCKWNSGTQDKPYCQKYSMGRLPEWFCADGVKKDG